MTPYVPSIVVDSVIDALKGFLQPFMGTNTPIIRGQQNRVAAPVVAGNSFAKLTEIRRGDLSTPIVTSDPANLQVQIAGPSQIDIQVDVYGPSSGDQSKAIQGVYRSPYAPAQFPDGIKPLFCSDAHQSPLVTGEEQYETRWTFTASLQYNPVVAVPSESATSLTFTSHQES